MKIRFVRSWRRWKAGDMMEPADGWANVLIRRHIAEEVSPSPPKRQHAIPRVYPAAEIRNDR